MAVIADGDRIAIEFKGWLEDVTEFVTSADRGPLEFTVGSDEIMRGLSSGVIGMSTGESEKFSVPPEQGFGHRDPDLMHTVSRDQVPDDVKVGDELTATSGTNPTSFLVREVTETQAVIDANHPLAGRTMTFEVNVVSHKTEADSPQE